MKKHTTLKSKFNSAFSLVELLVVIAVIAVIAAIAIPNITGVREAAQSAQTSYNADTIARIVSQAAAVGATNTSTGGVPSTNDAIGTIYRTVITNGTTLLTNEFRLQ